MKIFTNKNRKIIFFCMIFIVIISIFIKIRDIKEIDIYGHKILIFIEKKSSAYLLNPVTIKTEFGNIYLKRFAHISWPYIFSDADNRTRYDWDRIKLYVERMGKDIKYDLNLFWQNLELENSFIELDKISIDIWSINQPIIINGEKQRLQELYHVRGSNEIRLKLLSAPSFFMTTTLNGEILEIDTD